MLGSNGTASIRLVHESWSELFRGKCRGRTLRHTLLLDDKTGPFRYLHTYQNLLHRYFSLSPNQQINLENWYRIFLPVIDTLEKLQNFLVCFVVKKNTVPLNFQGV